MFLNVALTKSLLFFITICIVINGSLLKFSQSMNDLQIVLVSIFVVFFDIFYDPEICYHRLLNFI